MSDLEQATLIVERLRSVIETELVQARGQRLLIRALDTPGLFERARQRGAFNVQLAQLEQELAKALAAVGQALGLAELTLADLHQISPQGAQRLDHSLAEVRVLTEALREIDSINRKLGERALGRVRRTLSAMIPRPVAYDRRGAHQPMEALSTSSRVA
jgi:glutathione S-transferase